jgi:hypothetical protein
MIVYLGKEKEHLTATMKVIYAGMTKLTIRIEYVGRDVSSDSCDSSLTKIINCCNPVT